MKPLNNDLENLFIEVQLKPKTKPYTNQRGSNIHSDDVSVLEGADKLVVGHWCTGGIARVTAFDAQGKYITDDYIHAKHIRRVKKESNND